ncbi:MAG: c-type cytochrome, partial [Beijerinckiaceae bacterium]
MRTAAFLFAAVAAWAATTRPAAADAARGRAFARENCGRCHDVGRGASPLPKAPNFAALARKYRPADLEEALAEGIVTGHSAMPEFTLSPRQI